MAKKFFRRNIIISCDKILAPLLRLQFFIVEVVFKREFGKFMSYYL